MTWFKNLAGVDEQSPFQVRQQLSVEGDCIVCPNGKRLAFGRLEMPKLQQLRAAVDDNAPSSCCSTVRECVGDVRKLHAAPENANALFQVASQFNLLEMVGPSVTPERGIGIYDGDPTQGPACAIACGAGTIYRNYFVPVDGSVGQSSRRQIDCSADLGRRLGNVDARLWGMRNGYLLPTTVGLAQIANLLQGLSEAERDEIGGELKIGLQWNTAVTLSGAGHRVSQAYCSALPVAYGRQPVEEWAPFAQLVLDAAYEATICAAIINASESGCNRVYLTLLGGGAFGNPEEWIISAIRRAILKYRQYSLDIEIVSYGRSKPAVAALVSSLR